MTDDQDDPPWSEIPWTLARYDHVWLAWVLVFAASVLVFAAGVLMVVTGRSDPQAWSMYLGGAGAILVISHYIKRAAKR